MKGPAHGTSLKGVAFIAAGAVGLGAWCSVFSRGHVSCYIADACTCLNSLSRNGVGWIGETKGRGGQH